MACLQETLETLSPMSRWEVEVQPHKAGGLEFRIEAHMGSYVNLTGLHEHLRRMDDRLLPSILHAIERLSSGVAPSVGPHGAEGYAEYWWNLDRLAEFDLPDRIETQHDFSTRQTLVLARRLGLAHQWQVRDKTPWPYFRPALDMTGTIDLLQSLGPPPAGDPVRYILAQLADLLREGQLLREQLPVMTHQEDEECSSLPPVYTIYGVMPGANCAVYDVMDEFMRYQMEGGEHDPCMVLYVDERPETHARLIQYLRTAPQLLGALDRIERMLIEAEALL
ncbi:hypothetical protein [Deinococcus sp. Leaf326]|uniref:hypothetical protein n=1 Tax=Deinococcus sp. Leaf326 TaxID=1736338 RepID=UPI0006F420DE|nr:hypothetical protein [Deinococcus sp. Leaf326]KQR25541.1 hypothetical protein ASF71_19255 [Deinococcus sp. Leaf326]